jgi:hypothetical protein
VFTATFMIYQQVQATKIWHVAGWDYPGCINPHIYSLSLKSEKVMVCAAPQRGGIAVPVQDFCKMREARWSRPSVLRTLFWGIKTTFESKHLSRREGLREWWGCLCVHTRKCYSIYIMTQRKYSCVVMHRWHTATQKKTRNELRISRMY